MDFNNNNFNFNGDSSNGNYDSNSSSDNTFSFLTDNDDYYYDATKNHTTDRDSLINKLTELGNSSAFAKLNNLIVNIISIIINIAFLVGIWGYYTLYIKHHDDRTYARIAFFVILFISITFVCSIINGVVSIYLSNLYNKTFDIYNCTDEELRQKEKVANLILATCNFLNSLVPTSFAVFLGSVFIVAGVYFGLFADENSSLGFLFIFPLMGLGAIIAFSLPTINSFKELLAIKNDINFDYDETSQNKFNSKRLLIVIFGLIFLFSGITCIIGGIRNFGTDAEMINKIGLIIFGLPFCAIGAFVIKTNDKWN